MATREQRAERIRALNDEMRSSGPAEPSVNRWVLTRGVLHLGEGTLEAIFRAVMNFADFDADNDPHGEHDFGSVVVGGQKIFWKIDYYDTTLTEGSPDPANEAATTRVLTIMLALEY